MQNNKTDFRNNMNIISWNVNGIRAIVKKDFLNWFNDANADIICIQETMKER